MRTIIKQSTAALVLLAVLAFTSPAHAAASKTITIGDVQTFNPETFFFPGGPAFGFNPGLATVAQGGTVDFYDRGFEEHTVTSYTDKMTVPFEGVMVSVPIADGTFDSGTIEHGETFTLDTSGLSVGDYQYFCQIHPWMQGTLNVVDQDSPSHVTINIDHSFGQNGQFFAASASWGFFPRKLVVQQGVNVEVVNQGILPHTFTSYTNTISVEEGGRTLMIPMPDATFDSGSISATNSYNLNTGGLDKGTYLYFCQFHPWMLGSLTVS